MRRKIIAVLASACITILLSEMLISRFLPQKTYSQSFKNAISCFTKSDYAVFQLKPNCTIQFHNFDTGEIIDANINSLGYRGKELDEKKKSGEKRILFEGDSFILGFGVKDEELVTSHVEKKLKDVSSSSTLKNASVINAGYAGGFGPDGYYTHLREKGKALQPDLVIFNVFVYNDLSDLGDSDWVRPGPNGEPQWVESKKIYVDENGFLLPKDTPLIYRIPVLRESHIMVLTANMLGQLVRESYIVIDKIKFKIFTPQFPTGEARDTNLPGGYANLCFFAGMCHRSTYHLFTDLLTVIKASNEIANARLTDGRKHLVVVLIPADFQIYKDALDKYTFDDMIPKDIYKDPNPQPQRRIKEMLEKEGIAHIDLLDIMRQSKERLYFPTDGHWNAKGHAIAAAEIYKWIVNNYR